MNAEKTRASADRRLPGFGSRHAEHRQRDIQRDPARGGIAQRELGLRVAGAAAGVEDGRGRELHHVEPLGHPAPDFPLQDRRPVVGRGGPREMTAHRAGVHGRRNPRPEGRQRVIEKRVERRAEGVGVGKKRHVRGAGDQREARIRQVVGKPPAGPGQRKRVARAGNDQRRLRDRADFAAQVRVPDQRERAEERLR